VFYPPSLGIRRYLSVSLVSDSVLPPAAILAVEYRVRKQGKTVAKPSPHRYHPQPDGSAPAQRFRMRKPKDGETIRHHTGRCEASAFGLALSILAVAPMVCELTDNGYRSCLTDNITRR